VTRIRRSATRSSSYLRLVEAMRRYREGEIGDPVFERQLRIDKREPRFIWRRPG
jgi:hypothetical protein